MNHTLVAQLPHIEKIYNKSRYISRLYSCNSQVEVCSVLVHGVRNKFLNEDAIMGIYSDADRRISDHDVTRADWIMSELGPLILKPGPVRLSVVCRS